MRLVCQGLAMSYGAGPARRPALAPLDLDVPAGQFLGILGPSGCGKSSLLGVVAGLLAPSAGSVSFPDWSAPGRPRCLMAFQADGLMPWLTVADNVAFPLEVAGVARAERRARAVAALTRLGLAEVADRHPAQLSGGMRQRVGLARLFVADPDLLLMDEPFSALDAQTRLLLQRELLKVWAARPRTVLYVTHDIEEAILLSDRLLVLSAGPGRVIADIPVPLPRPRRVIGPQPPAVAELRWRIWEMLAPAEAAPA